MTFDDVALIYDDAIDWEARLGHEMPFLLAALGEPSGKAVLDLACGSGRHAIELALMGATVTGLDISSSMLIRARELADARGAGPNFIESDMVSFDDALRPQKFDVIMCIGNSLALLEDQSALERVLESAFSRLDDGGVLLAQVLNFEEIRHSGFRFFPVKAVERGDGTVVVFFRFFEHLIHQKRSDLVVVTYLQNGLQWQSEISVQSVLNLERESICDALHRCGFAEVECFGGYDRRPLHPKSDRNIVITAHK